MNRSTNLNMYLPENSDMQDVSQLTYNFDTLDGVVGSGVSGTRSIGSALAATDNAIAIVSTGNTHSAITAGQFVYVKDHGTLSEGLYKASSNISANATLSGSNLTAVTGGGLNAVNGNFTSA